MAARFLSIPNTFVLFAKRGLYERFQQTLTHLGWKRKDETVLLGLSGGRDSVCLLHLLLVSGHQVIAAHLNHQLRGKESAADEQWVKRLCKTWKIPLVVEHENVLSRAQRYKLSIEETARIARYRFLGRTAQKLGIKKIVVAHHQKDQAETILLKIFRGCSRQDLQGMKMSRPLPLLTWRSKLLAKSKTRMQLIRPMLEATSLEIALYARQNRLAFREDRSNHDLAYSRNWIRHQLLPLIERKLNRNVIKTLARLGEQEERIEN